MVANNLHYSEENPLYNVEDGVGVLEYLGLQLTEDGKDLIRKKWRAVVREGFVGQLETLYADVIPYTHCGSKDIAEVVSRIREEDFDRRMRISEFDEQFERGVPLRDILARGPHHFLSRYEGELVDDLGIGSAEDEGQ